VIQNANLISMTTPPVSDGNGGQAAGVTTTFSTPVRCCVDDPTQAQIVALAGKLADVTAVLYVPMPLPGGYGPQQGGDAVVQQDGLASRALRIARLMPRVHAGQSHYEMFLQER
jgi:hypothetical protein